MAQGNPDEPTTDNFDEEPLEDTHYGHVRYAANDTAGVRWFDPRTGQEHLRLPKDGTLDEGERRLFAVKIVPYRPEEFGTPTDQYATERIYQRREGDYTHQSRARGEIHDALSAARDHLREIVDDYDDYPRKDAVEARTGTDFTTVEGVSVVEEAD